MSTPVAAPPRGTIRCPRCDATLGPEQDWCLECGAPARTRLAPLPNWKLPATILAVIALAAGIALAVAFVSLTNDGGSTTTTTAATTPAATTPAVAPVPGATTPAPATTTPAPATTVPPATTVAPTPTTTIPGPAATTP